MFCPFCKKKVIHTGDHDYEDYCMDGDGIVSNGCCTNEDCEVDTIIIYRDIKWKHYLGYNYR